MGILELHLQVVYGFIHLKLTFWRNPALASLWGVGPTMCRSEICPASMMRRLTARRTSASLPSATARLVRNRIFAQHHVINMTMTPPRHAGMHASKTKCSHLAKQQGSHYKAEYSYY